MFNSARKPPAWRNGKKTSKERYHQDERHQQHREHQLPASYAFEYPRQKKEKKTAHVHVHAHPSALGTHRPPSSSAALSDSYHGYRAGERPGIARAASDVSSETASRVDDALARSRSPRNLGARAVPSRTKPSLSWPSRACGADIYVARIGRSGELGIAHPCSRCLEWCRWAGVRRVFHWNPMMHRFDVVKAANFEHTEVYMTTADRRLAAGKVSKRAPVVLGPVR
jgi:hypothetical protein